MWYAAHLILYVKFKDGVQDRFPLYENVVLLEAPSEEVAFQSAARLGHEEEGDCEGTFRWDGRPAELVFAGVRKLIECRTPGDVEDKPASGTEVTYSQMVVGDEETLSRLINGEPVNVLYEE